MKTKQLIRFICIITLFILSVLVFAQSQPVKKSNRGFDEKFWILAIIALLGFAFGVYQYIRRRKDARRIKIAQLEAEKEFKDQEQSREARTAEEIYSAALKGELGTLHLPGSPDIECTTVKLEDAFVSLCISESRRNDLQFADHKK
jgi:NADH:ubiquinone oxidoreductase subunit 2 (subunit N)